MLCDKNGPVKLSKREDFFYNKILDKLILYILLPAQLAFSIFFLILTVWVSLYEYQIRIDSVVNFLFDLVLCMFIFIGPAILFLAYSIVYCSDVYKKHKIKEDGLWMKYPLEPWRNIPWDEFQEVCVCYAGHHGVGRAYAVICCVKKGEKYSWLTGRWKSDNPFKYRSVITFDYTDELYEEFKENCPYPVKDLRNTRRYKVY